MAVSDLLAYLQDRMRVYDPTVATEEGSDFFQKVLRPLKDRLGEDPFTTDTRAFLLDVLARNYPNLAQGSADALVEALVPPMESMIAPVTAEISRVQGSLSLARPDLLSTEEADALGANHLIERERGDYAKGVVRILFRKPQQRQVEKSHVFSTPQGLSFTPVTEQSISAADMLFNTFGSYYYMNVSVIAVEPGDQYNIDPGQIDRVAGLSGYESVTNPYRFQGGLAEQTAEEFVASIPDRTGSSGMTQPGGIIRELSKVLPTITRMAVVGHGDPEMQRDILQGAGLGELLAVGFAASALPDGSGSLTTTSVLLADSEGLSSLGGGLILSLFHETLPNRGFDVEVTDIPSGTHVRVEESLVPLGLESAVWTLRKKDLRIQKAPLLPILEETEVPPGQVHVGGAVDIYLRSGELDPSTAVVDALDDDTPLLLGLRLDGSGSGVTLKDLVLGTSYQEGSDLQKRIQSIWPERWALEILSGPSQGVYEVLDVTEAEGLPVALTLYSDLPVATVDARWRILDRINLDLLSPKRVRWPGDDGETTQGLAFLTTTSLVHFSDVGVEQGDIVEILSGPDKGTYTVSSVTGPGYTRLVLNRPLSRTASKVPFRVYKENAAAPLDTPVVRLTKVVLLDSEGKSLGVEVPPGECLGAVSQGISNPGRGVKLSVPDALLGIISNRFPSGASLNLKTLWLWVEGRGNYSVTFAGTNPISMASAAAQINAKVGVPIAVVVGDRLGIYPLGGKEVKVTGPLGSFANGAVTLFGGVFDISAKSIRSPSFSTTSFTSLSPALSLDYDVVQFRDGAQIGVHRILSYSVQPSSMPSGTLYPTNALLADVPGGFFPEADVSLELGARSAGVVRTYFRNPVTVEFDQNTRVTHTDENGGQLVYRPDPFFSATLIPAAPKGLKPLDGNCLGGDRVLNSNLDFRAKQIRAGDRVVIDFVPLLTSVLSDPVADLAGTTLLFSYGAEAQQILTFIKDDPSLPDNAVSRDGVIQQIQRYLGASAVSLEADNRLKLNPEYLVSLGRAGTANPLFGFSASVDTNNRSLNAGTYTVRVPGNLGCELEELLAHEESRMQFSVQRLGSQRFGATVLSAQLGEEGLYYADLEVVSEGTGDVYNLSNGESFDVEGHRHDGYTLSTNDETRTFSTEEMPRLALPRRVNAVGTNDDPEESTYLLGKQLQVTSDSANVVREAQEYLDSDAGRDTASIPLARALTPHFIHLAVNYVGGPSKEEVEAELSRKIHALFPEEALAVDDIVQIVRALGASSMQLPMRLFAVVVGKDRKVRLHTSLDRISAGNQSAFYPTGLVIRRSRG